jgi:predicted permease
MKNWPWSNRNRRRREDDLDEEIQAHLRMAADEHAEKGKADRQAHAEALREFGNVVLVKEVTRDMWGYCWLETLLQDLRYGLRQLRRSPGFTLMAVLTLALGIGANTAIFSVMYAVALRFLPVQRPEQLVFLRLEGRPENTSETGDNGRTFTEYTFEQLRGERRIFSDLMAFVPLGFDGVPVRFGAHPEIVTGDMVSGNFFSGLGVQPAGGRVLTLEDEKQHASVAVISYNYWTRRFARDPSVIGETLYVRGVPFTLVGVAAPRFWGVEPGQQTDLWVPLQNGKDVTAWGNPGEEGTLYSESNWWCLMMIGRLQRGLNRQQALAQLNPLFVRTAYEGAGKPNPKAPAPYLYFSSARGISWGDVDAARPVISLMAMVCLVLLIACTNVAMLLVARNTARQREFALRSALGAGRARLFRQLLTESLLLVSGGTVLGWILAGWTAAALARWAELDFNVAPDLTALLFTLAISIAAALAFGLAPLRGALRPAPGAALKISAASSGQDRSGFRSGQVALALQMALCLVLLIGAGLLVRTLRNLENADLGLNTTGLLVFGIAPPKSVHGDAETVQFFQTMTEHLRTLPGVESATLMQNRIGAGWSNNTIAMVDGVSMKDRQPSDVRWNSVGPDYFHVIGTPLEMGRDFKDSDSTNAPNVAIINQTFARTYLPGENPVGHAVSLDYVSGKPFTVVGVAADSRYTRVREKPKPMAYFPYSQLHGVGTMHFELRTAGDPSALLPEVERVVHKSGPDLPLIQPMTQQEQFDKSFSEGRLFARLATAFGILAALLVATGLYGTLSYKVGRRTAEIGVRMALGAGRGDVFRMVLRESLALGLTGIAIGLPLAWAAAKMLRSMLYGLEPGDPVTFVGALISLALLALFAGYVPARRASKIEPMAALRYE